MTTTAGLVIQLWFYIFPVKKAQEMPPPPPPPEFGTGTKEVFSFVSGGIIVWAPTL